MTTPPNNPTYNQNTPKQSGESLAESQIKFLTNFQELYDAFSVNHVALDGGATAGNHKIAEFFQQVGDFQASQGEVSAYSKDVEGQTNQLFLNNQGGSFQYTCYQIYGPSSFGGQLNYFTFLPGNIMVSFGIINPAASPGGNKLDFSPYVYKNLMTFNICPGALAPTIIPTFTLQEDFPGTGIISAVRLYQLTAGYSYFYLAVGNL